MHDRRFVIGYDVSCDKRRRKVAKTLEAFGLRAQYSVFEAVLPTAVFDMLIAKLRTLLDPRSDSLVVYPLCRTCSLARDAWGTAPKGWPDPEPVVVI